MAEDKPRLARLTAIITQLQSKRLVTAREIAKKHKVSVRTIYRDIRTLEQSGIPIITQEGKGYSIMDGYKLPPVMFTEPEANALITAEQLIAHNKDKSLYIQYKSAIEKIRAVLNYTQKGKAELLSERIYIRSEFKYQKTSNYLIQLQSAITSYKTIDLDYLALNEKQSKRKVEPFALLNTKDNWMLVAFCQLRNDFRTFRLDRIQNILTLNDCFEPHKLTLQEYFAQKRKERKQTPDIPLTQPTITFVSNKKNSTMKKVNIEPFKVIGIAVRTTNENGQSGQDIGQLWGKFMSEGIAGKIPSKINSDVLSIYTNYQGDHTQPYDTILGCKVSSLEQIPEGMVGQSFEGGTYTKFTSKGDLTKGVVYGTWSEIWKQDLDRVFTADFEVYGEKAQNPTDAEVDILVAVKG